MNKLKDYENIILIGSNKEVYISCYNKDQMRKSEKVKVYRYSNDKLPCNGSELYARDTNALYIVNKFLAKAAKLVNTENDNCVTVKMYINNSLYNKIVSGKYKYWINTGMTKSGKVLDTKEKDEWVKFAKLYGKVFTRIEFAATSVYSTRQFMYNQKEMEYGRSIHRILKAHLEKSEQKNIEDIIAKNM